MNGGLTPYDKENYRQSKKRRRQALIEEKTGRIVPINSGEKRRVMIAVCCIAVFVLSAVGFITASYLSGITAEESAPAEQTEDNSAELLRVVNADNPLDESYAPDTVEVGGVSVSALAGDALEDMLAAAESDGVALTVTRGYVSYSDQRTLYEQKLAEYLSDGGYSEVRAEAAAKKEEPPCGESESQTGLLIKFDVSDDKTSTWLEYRCVDFGFVKRYTDGKEDVTSMNASDSLYRYVGGEYALKMRAFGMCLEEFSEYVSVRETGD